MSTNLGRSVEPGYAMTGVCTTCGFDPAVVAPKDAIEALQALPTQWRSVLAVHLDDADPARALSARTSAMAWSALEHAGHVRDVVHALDIRLQRVLREESPTIPETHVTPPSGANEQGLAVILAALTMSADQMSGTVESASTEAWTRVAQRRQRPVTAIDLVREAVHEGRHHLHLARQGLAEVRSTSSTPVG